MAADQDAVNIEQGTDPNSPTGFVQGWFSRIRARKVLGDNVNKAPYTRQWPGGQTVASPMSQDKVTAIADAVGWRKVTVNNPAVPAVVDVGDMIAIAWEYFLLESDPAKLAQAVKNAGLFLQWPAGYQGKSNLDSP
jgi:hypothetical protein